MAEGPAWLEKGSSGTESSGAVSNDTVSNGAGSNDAVSNDMASVDAVSGSPIPADLLALVNDHHEALYRYAYRLTGSVHDAEDLTQQAFLVAQQKVAQVRSSECVRSWLYTVLRNCYLKSARQRVPVSAADFELESQPSSSTPADSAIDSEQLQAAINTLADDFKTVVLMFYFEHRAYREIAEQLSVPLGTVMSRLARAKAHLRQLLSEDEHDRSPRAGPGSKTTGRQDTARKDSAEKNGPAGKAIRQPTPVRH